MFDRNTFRRNRPLSCGGKHVGRSFAGKEWWALSRTWFAMRFRRMRYAIWLPLAAKAVACLGAAGATKPLAPTAKAARMAVLSMITDATAAVCAALALRGRV